jgi:hypothetical protein
MTDQAAAAKEQLSKQADERKKANDEANKRMESSKPTPSQEENDLARLGAPPEKLADDGSGPEPKVVLVQRVTEPTETRELTPESKPAASSYQTRQTTPAKSGT